MKRPLGLVVLLYGGGLLLAKFLHPPLPFLFAISLALAAAGAALSRLRPLLLGMLLVFSGWTNLVCRTAVISPHDLRRLLEQGAELAEVRGVLEETPRTRITVRNGKQSARTLAQLRVVELRREGHWQPAFGCVITRTRGELPEAFFAGQEVKVMGIVTLPSIPVAEGLFDYRDWLRRQGIYFELRVSAPQDWSLISSNNVRPVGDRFVAWARAALSRDLPAKDEALRLLWAMTLGWKTALTAEVYEPFAQSGTMHIFAISGLHIAMIAAILLSVLRVLRLPRSWCGLVVIPLLCFYTGATGWQPSAIRSSVMMSVVIGGWSLGRPSDLLNSLCAAALIILLWDPQQLFQAGFQLSFCVVLSIALVLPPLEKIRDRLLQSDPLLPPDLVPRWQRWLGGPLRYVLTGLATSMAAWLGSWPLIAHYFHLFSPITLLANLFILPLSSAALASAMGSLFCGSWFPWAGALFNHSAWFWMRLMMETSRVATAMPGAFFYVRSPSPADFVIYYGALVAVLTGFALAPRRRLWSGVVFAGLAAFYLWQWQAGPGNVKLTILPLNGGASIYTDSDRPGEDLLVDCGNANAFEFVLKPFLRAQGVNHLPCLALTHGDLRQVGGAEPLLAMMPVGQIAIGPTRFRSRAYRQIVDQLDRIPGQRRVLNPGDQLGRWTVLHPDKQDRFPRADDAALVLSGEFYGHRILLLSDLGRPGQETLLARSLDLRAEVAVAGLPEKSEPLCQGLLEAIRPKLIIITDSEFPATRRASRALRERLARGGIPVVYTRQSGAVTIRITRQGWQVMTMNGQP